MFARVLVVLASLSLALSAQTPASIVQAEFDGPVYDPATSMGGPNLLLGLKTQAVTTFGVTRIEVFTGSQHGTNSIAIWSHDPVTNAPGQQLGVGTWDMAWINGWQGATISPPVVLTQGQDLWVVWGCMNGSQSPKFGTGTGAQPYRPSFDGGLTWGGPYQSIQWKLRLWTGTTVGNYETYGAGCASGRNGVSEIGFEGLPLTGQSFDVLLARGFANSAAFLGIGLSDTSWLGQPLPAPLSPYGGLATCNAYASVFTQFFAMTDAAGSARVTLALPNNPALVGWQFFDQWWLLDGGAGSLGLVLSNAGRGSIGF